MKTIRIAFVGFWSGFNKTDNFIVNILKQRYYVQVMDTSNEYQRQAVQYLFYSDFSDEYLQYSCIRIFYTGENVCPDMNECDYAIGFDYMSIGDRYIRYPLYLACYEKDVKEAMTQETFTDEEQLLKRKFCAMVVSNAQCANPIREEVFRKLSEYKQVDSGGRFLNNVGCPEGVLDKLEFQKNYKFSIAFENSSHPGYCTEKIVQSYAAKTIPIYWGDPTVEEQFEKGSFINGNEYKNIDQLVEKIIEIDQNDELYISMLQKRGIKKEINDALKQELEKWIFHIVDQEYDKAYRRNLYGRCIAKEIRKKKSLEAVCCNMGLKQIISSKLKNRLGRFKKKTNHKNDERNYGEKNPDIVFYVIKRENENLGLLSYFNTNLGHINYAINNGWIPIIDMKNYPNSYLESNEVGRKNAWEFYFQQPYGEHWTLDEVYQSKHVRFSGNQIEMIRPDDDMDFLMNPYAQRYWNKIYTTYCKINSIIENEVEQFYENEFMKFIGKGERILGVLLRGTDYYALRPKAHPIQPDIEEAVNIIAKRLEEWNCSRIYLVTEDIKILQEIQKRFGNQVFRYSSQMYKYSGSGYISDAQDNGRDNDKYEHGKEYLCSVLLLTKCNCFLGGRTSGTVAMHVMSKGFEHEEFFDYGRYGTAEYKRNE